MIPPDENDYSKEAEIDFGRGKLDRLFITPIVFVEIVSERASDAMQMRLKPTDPWWEQWSLRFNQLWLERIDRLTDNTILLMHHAALVYWWNRNEKIKIASTSKHRWGMLRRLDKDAKALKKIADGDGKINDKVRISVTTRFLQLRRHLHQHFNASRGSEANKQDE